MFEKHLEKHGLDTIAYHTDPIDKDNMLLLFSKYSKFSVEEIHEQNKVYDALYDDYDNVIECFINSLNKELCKDILAQTDNDTKFSEVFMIFIEHE